MTLEQSEQATKEIIDWAGYTNLDRMRAASPRPYTVGSLYTAVTGKRTRMTGAPIVDGYVSLRSFDAAATNNTLANVPYMIGYTLNDMQNMSAGIAAFALNRQKVGDKVHAYEFARPLPTDGRDNVLKGAFHSSDLWYVFKSLKHSWRPNTAGDWQLAEVELTAWSTLPYTAIPTVKARMPGSGFPTQRKIPSSWFSNSMPRIRRIPEWAPPSNTVAFLSSPPRLRGFLRWKEPAGKLRLGLRKPRMNPLTLPDFRRTLTAWQKWTRRQQRLDRHTPVLPPRRFSTSRNIDRRFLVQIKEIVEFEERFS